MVILFFVYLVFIVVGCLWGKDLRYYFVFVTIVLAILAFFHTPNDLSDLVVAYNHLDGIRVLGWSYFAASKSWTVYFTGLPTLQLYYYLISLLQVNNFLPAITVIIIYGLTFHRVYVVAKTNNLKKEDTLKIALFIILFFDFFGLVSGIRNLLAFSVFAYYLYVDLEENRNKLLCWIVYIACFGMHSSCSILIIIRLLLYINIMPIKIAVIALVTQLGGNLDKIAIFLGAHSGNSIVNTLLMKFTSYTEGGNEINMETPYYYQLIINNRLVFCFCMSVIIVILLYKYKPERRNPLIMTYIYLCSLLVGIYLTPKVSYQVYIRYSNMIILLAPTIWAKYYGHFNNAKIVKSGNNMRIQLVEIPFILITLVALYYMMRYSYYTMEFALKLFM